MITKKVPKNTKRKDSKRSSDLGSRLEKKVGKMGGKELNHWPKDAQKRNVHLKKKAGEPPPKLQALNSELSFKVNELEAKVFELQQTQNRPNQLASFPEMNPNPVVEVNFDGSIQYLNPAARKLFPDLQDMGHQHEWLADLEFVGTLLKDQKKNYYVREVKVNGNWYHQSFHMKPGLDRIRIYGLDITERKQTEESLRQSEANFRILADNTYDMEFWINPEGQYIFVSPSCERITGHDRNEFMENPRLQRDLVHPEDLPIFDRHLQEEVTSQEVQFRIIRTDGSIRWIGHVCQRIFDTEGHFLGIRGSNRDITERKQMEEELRKSRDELEMRVHQRTAELAKANELLERMFSSIGIMIAYMDKDFNFIRVNRAYAKADEREPEFYVGKNHFVLFPNEENEQIFRKVVETGEPYSVYAKPFEYAEHPERGVTHWDWSLQAVKDPDGSMGGVVLSLVNVTERIRAEESVHQQAALLDLAHDAIIIRDIEDRILFWNHGAEELYGWEKSEALEKVAPDILQTEFPIQLDEIKIDLIRRGKWEGELVHTRRDGKKVIVESRWVLQQDKEGRPTLILQINRDITKRKRAEEALRTASLYTRNLIEASLDPLVTISPDGKVTDVNRATEQVTGFSREELIGTDFSNYFTEPDKASEGYQQVFLQGSVRDYPLAIRHVSGKVTDVLYHATVYKNEVEEIQGVFAAARDITERKRMEEELRKSENRLRLLSSQLLTVQEAERKRIAREIHDSLGQTLAAIKFGLESKLSQMGTGAPPPGVSIENIISLTQNGIEESRRIQMDLRPSVLDDLGILATIGWFAREFQKVYVHISVEKQISVEENEIPDSLRTVLFRVMQEAMNNVAKHSKADLVRLSLRKMKDRIELSIEDNGVGFDQESIKQGLGLTSMRERTELSGGTFEIESTIGKGTVIRVSWTT